MDKRIDSMAVLPLVAMAQILSAYCVNLILRCGPSLFGMYHVLSTKYQVLSTKYKVRVVETEQSLAH